jgi:4'-phosphopantetheinyl transferase
LHHFTQLLSRDEIEGADRFHMDIDRNHFIVGRGSLRIILGRYLRVHPASLNFEYTSYGKPSLAQTNMGLDFNLAHSGELALVGVTRSRRIGVDLERIRSEFPAEEIARRFFSPREVARLCSLPVDQRCRAFFNCWVRKEAFIKAKGVGLSIALDRFDVGLGAEDPLLLRWDDIETDRWSLKTIEVAPDYAAAVAVDGRDWQFGCWHINPIPEIMDNLQ